MADPDPGSIAGTSPESATTPSESKAPLATPAQTVFTAEARPGAPSSVKTAHQLRTNLDVLIGAAPSQPDPIAEKLTGAHITKVLDNADKQDRRQWISNLTDKGLTVAVVLAVLIFAGLVIHWMIEKGQYAVAEKVVITLLGFVGGYGARAITEKRKDRQSEEM